MQQLAFALLGSLVRPSLSSASGSCDEGGLMGGRTDDGRLGYGWGGIMGGATAEVLVGMRECLFHTTHNEEGMVRQGGCRIESLAARGGVSDAA
jgi:hypothetical protein